MTTVTIVTTVTTVTEVITVKTVTTVTTVTTSTTVTTATIVNSNNSNNSDNSDNCYSSSNSNIGYNSDKSENSHNSHNRDLKIPGCDKQRRLLEVNLHTEACAHDAQTHVLVILVSSRLLSFVFWHCHENVSISSLVFTYNKMQSTAFFRYVDPDVSYDHILQGFCWKCLEMRRKGHNLCPLFIAGVLHS